MKQRVERQGNKSGQPPEAGPVTQTRKLRTERCKPKWRSELPGAKSEPRVLVHRHGAGPAGY